MPEAFHLEQGAAQLAGEESGDGRAVVLLHAGVADRRMWREQLEALGESHHVLAYDRRGFGETTSPDERFSHTGDLAALLDHFGIGAAALVGCSQGGRIAIDFALLHPERVTALVLMAPAISGAAWPDSFPAEIEERIAALEAAERADDLPAVNALEAGLWLDGPTSPAGRVSGAPRELFLEMNGIALGKPELTREVEPASALERLADVSARTLVLWGDLDFPHVAECCRELERVLPDARGVEVRGAAHLLNLERPMETNEMLRSFLAG